MNKLAVIIIATTLFSCSQEKYESAANCKLTNIKTSFILGRSAVIGSNATYPEEYERNVIVRDFDIDTYEVTNADFEKFITATGYITTAEKPQPGIGKAGGAVFKTPTRSNPNWWQFVEGANWRNPEGPNSTIIGRKNHPVVQVSLVDAKAYALWAGRKLPTESEWEYAARAGSSSTYIWGEERAPNGIERANTWQGAFPIENKSKDGFFGTAPVGCFEPNGYGLYDMIGNVWEWTLTEYAQSPTPNSFAIKGGSYLCAENYCARYRAPARQSQEADFSTNHIGFRTVSQIKAN